MTDKMDDWTLLWSLPEFVIGQKVRPSQLGKDRNIFQKRHYDRLGVVTKVDRWNCPTVLWDGRKTTDYYFGGFVEAATAHQKRKLKELSKRKKAPPG